MIVSGLGTQDSPILLDDDSESEVVSELIDFPSSHLAHRDDSEFTLRLSPRPGTILSNKARLNLSQSSAQNLRKYRQGTMLSLVFGHRVTVLSPRSTTT